MASYVLKYSGEQIDEALGKALSAVQPEQELININEQISNKAVKYDEEQNLDNLQAKVAGKNILIKDDNGNFYLGSDFYDKAFTETSTKPSHCVFGTNFRQNIFGGSGDNSHNIFGNNVNGNSFVNFAANVVGNNVSSNSFTTNTRHNTIGNNFHRNRVLKTFDSNQVGNDVQDNVFGNVFKGTISDCVFGNNIRNCEFVLVSMDNCRFDGNMSYVRLESNATETEPLRNIHVLAGIKGTVEQLLTINISNEYLNSSRELIITTKATDGGPSTPEDIIMYYADEVAIQSLTNSEIDTIFN